MSSLAGFLGDLAATGASVGVTRLLLQDDPAEIGQVVLHAAVKETHTATAVVTSHPIEAEPGEASEVSDHVKVDPLRLSIDGVISNTPAILGGAVQTLLTGGSFDPAQDAHKQFLDYLGRGQILKIKTTLKTYENMVLESMQVDRDADKGNALYFKATAKQLTTVQLKASQGGQQGDGDNLPGGTKTGGKVPPKVAPKELAEKSSAPFQLLDSVVPLPRFP